MTTAAAEPCGHRWLRTLCPASGYSGHRCDQPANHPATVRCRCRCGRKKLWLWTYTTTEETR